MWRRNRGRVGVSFIFNWDGIPDMRPNAIFYNALLSVYEKMEAGDKDVKSIPSKLVRYAESPTFGIKETVGGERAIS